MHDADDRRLTELRNALLRLHKTLLDWERMAYERFHGRVAGQNLLQAILSDPQFVWLRPLSELIVRIDEALADETSTDQVEAIVGRAREIVSAPETAGPYARRYREALQDYPDAVFAHRAVTDLVGLSRRSSDDR